MKNFLKYSLTILVSVTLLVNCDTIFGSKQDDTTDEIFREGRIPPDLQTTGGYAPVLPFWGGFDQPTDIFVGFDTFVYVTDQEGVHLLDRADLSPRRTIPLTGAVAVTQDRLLNIYVAARIDTVIDAIDPQITWNLPAVFKIKNLNGAGNLQFVDTLIFPFDDSSLSTVVAKRARLNRNSEFNYEQVQITGVTTLADNTLYVTRTGPKNDPADLASVDNTVLEFIPEVINGQTTGKMRNVRQIETLNPNTPSLTSAIGLSSISSFIAPPQRDSFSEDRGFLIAQADQSQDIPFRVLWIDAVETIDGLSYQANTSLLVKDTTAAESFLYDAFTFEQPAGVAFAGDQTRYIFVVDQAQHKLYQFQANGQEGVNSQNEGEKRLIVSFGGLGSGPKQFNSPSGVAYFDEVVYVADTGNNRIARYKLTTDFE